MHNNRVGSVVDSEKTVFQGSDEMMLNTLIGGLRPPVPRVRRPLAAAVSLPRSPECYSEIFGNSVVRF